MDRVLDFITTDWKKIPQNFRFLILGGSFLIFNTWLLDHWGSTNKYSLWGLDIRALFYSIGLSLILFCFVLLIAKQFIIFGRIIWLRRKYSLDKYGNSFNLVDFQGVLVLFDHNEKKYYFVALNDTMIDLSFDSLAFDPFPLPFTLDLLKKTQIPVGSQGKMVNMQEFKSGGQINTKE